MFGTKYRLGRMFWPCFIGQLARGKTHSLALFCGYNDTLPFDGTDMEVIYIECPYESYSIALTTSSRDQLIHYYNHSYETGARGAATPRLLS